MQANVIWTGSLNFTATTENSFSIPLESSPDLSGGGTAASPMELVALALAGCTGMDVISILQKKRQQVSSFEIRFTGERSEEHPRVFTRVTLEYFVSGAKIDRAAVERAVQLSRDKYCPVEAMLGKSVTVDHVITIYQTESTAQS
jgi:putative redox protein